MRTLLIKACENGNIKKIFEIKDENSFCGNCLNLAIKNGHINIVNLICDDWKVTPLIDNSKYLLSNMYWAIEKSMIYNQKDIELYLKNRIGIDKDTPVNIIRCYKSGS